MIEENNDKLKKIVDDYEQKEAASFKQQVKSQKEDQQRRWFRSALQGIGIACAGLLILQLLSNVLGEMGVFRKKVYWNLGGRQVQENNVTECIFKLWRIRQAVDLHYGIFKGFPENLESLENANMIHSIATCTITQRPYLFLSHESKKTLCCPDPEAHGVKGICLYWESGPPFIIR